jgi:hypothetical protein
VSTALRGRYSPDKRSTLRSAIASRALVIRRPCASP